jgi:AcrR family transcriptional regulator
MSSTSSPPRVGLRERQKRERRERILKAARELFERRGQTPSMIPDVAARAGLAVGTIYNYFPTKDDLLISIMKRESDRVRKIGAAVVKGPLPEPVEAFIRIADVYVDGVIADGRRLWREALIAAFSKPETIGWRLFELDMVLISQFQALIIKLKSAGKLHNGVDPFQGATLIYAVCLTWGMAFITSKRVAPQTMRVGVRTGIRLAINGLLPRSNLTARRRSGARRRVIPLIRRERP